VDLAEQPLWSNQFRLSDTGEPELNCPNVSTVTIQFSAPVSNAILHIGNLGGSGNFPASRKTYGFDKKFDMTLYSKWTLTFGPEHHDALG
jgi:hypothetical protein